MKLFTLLVFVVYTLYAKESCIIINSNRVLFDQHYHVSKNEKHLFGSLFTIVDRQESPNTCRDNLGLFICSEDLLCAKNSYSNIPVVLTDPDEPVFFTTPLPLTVKETPKRAKAPSPIYYVKDEHNGYYLLSRAQKNDFNTSNTGDIEGWVLKSNTRRIGYPQNNQEQYFVFLIDTTIGMKDYMPWIKKALKKFVKTYTKSPIMLISYKDKVDGINSFVKSKSDLNRPCKMRQYLTKLNASSNPKDKTYGESFLGALNKTLNMQEKITHIIVFADHGDSYKYPFREKDIADKLSLKNIHLHAIQFYPKEKKRAAKLEKYQDLFRNTIYKIKHANDKSKDLVFFDDIRIDAGGITNDRVGRETLSRIIQFIMRDVSESLLGKNSFYQDFKKVIEAYRKSSQERNQYPKKGLNPELELQSNLEYLFLCDKYRVLPFAEGDILSGDIEKVRLQIIKHKGNMSTLFPCSLYAGSNEIHE